MPETGWKLLLSCEHGGNLVPERWTSLFAGQEQILKTHRGYDIGIASFAQRLAGELNAPLHLAKISRLMIEINRSLGHPDLFSKFTKSLPTQERAILLEIYYHPFRNAVTQQAEELMAKGGNVCHISVHSFTPELHGVERNADIGLLYDPQRLREKQFCQNWQQNILNHGDNWRVRRNYPYRGTADGICTQLRRRFPAERYLGIELELNQSWPLQDIKRWKSLQTLTTETLRETIRQESFNI